MSIRHIADGFIAVLQTLKFNNPAVQYLLCQLLIICPGALSVPFSIGVIVPDPEKGTIVP